MTENIEGREKKGLGEGDLRRKAVWGWCAFSISTFLRPVSHISLSGPERMTNDFGCFVPIESER